MLLSTIEKNIYKKSTLPKISSYFLFINWLIDMCTWSEYNKLSNRYHRGRNQYGWNKKFNRAEYKTWNSRDNMFKLPKIECKLPCLHRNQSSNPPNHNISQVYSEHWILEEGGGHCRRKWTLNHRRTVVEKSCDHH